MFDYGFCLNFSPQSEDLFSLIETHEGKGLKLYVYNTDTDNCRDVVIIPNFEWGGEGRYGIDVLLIHLAEIPIGCPIEHILTVPFFSLGCGIGYGYLHRIPKHTFEEGKNISFPGHIPSEPVSPLKDGFTEVRHFCK